MAKNKLRKNRKNPKVHIDASGKVMNKNSKATINVRIRNRFNNKIEEFQKLTKDELEKLMDAKMSTTDRNALVTVIKNLDKKEE